MFTLKPAKACQALISYIWSCDISPALVLALTSYIWSHFTCFSAGHHSLLYILLAIHSPEYMLQPMHPWNPCTHGVPKV